MARRTSRTSIVVALISGFFCIAFLAGCSSSTSPSGAGATITGSVTTTSAEATSETSSGPSDTDGLDAEAAFSSSSMTVSVVGSSTTATVDASGHFTLTHVPGGDVTLRFDGSGGGGTVTLPAVQDGQTVTIAVSINGGTAELDSDDRSGDSGGLLQLEGRIDALPPVAAAGTFVVDGKIVITNGSTVFVNGDATAAFADLALGVRVHVSGTAQGANVLASRVDIQNTDATIPVVVNGIVSAFTGTAAAFQFTVDGTVVKGTSSTSFTGNSAFTDLANGKRVEVKGEPGNGFVTATSIHVNPN